MNKTVLLAVLCSPWSLIAMESSTESVPREELIEETALLKRLKNRQKLSEDSFNLIKKNSIKGIKKLEKSGLNTLPIGAFQRDWP